MEKWKNDINYKYDSEAYETLPKSRAQRDRIAELSEEIRNLNAENEQMRSDAKDRIKELSELKSRSISEEVDGLKELLHTATQEREEYKLEMEQIKAELQRISEKHAFEIADMTGAVEVARAEHETLGQQLNDAQSECGQLRETVGELKSMLHTVEANAERITAEHRDTLHELEKALASKSSDVEVEHSLNTSSDPVIISLISENLVTPSFDEAHLLVLNGVAHNRDAKAAELYNQIELAPVHIDYCLVELVEQGLIQANVSEYEENGYELTQRGRRAYVRASSLEALC